MSEAGPDPKAVARLLEVLQAYERDGTPALAAALHPEIDWEIPDTVANPGHEHGPAAVMRSADTWTEAWAEMRYEPREIFGEGPRVVMEMHTSIVGQASGIPIEGTLWWAAELRDGLVVRGGIYPDREGAEARLGL